MFEKLGALVQAGGHDIGFAFDGDGDRVLAVDRNGVVLESVDNGLGWRTIAQDESSSVVWGMPRAAIEIGAAEEVLHLDRIAEAIARLVPK